RKVGHINLSHPDPVQLIAALGGLAQDLPAEYQSSADWAKTRLSW
ncbi:5-(carboxyamino)imidazole ribonucleotide synthase, partial [Salmonella enterica subsp. enterica serovar Offa]|nr:5-(carboxyamino)imidazole ribonucleotide synthase [Salmonella enterica subsp. enterica serovar Offa]